MATLKPLDSITTLPDILAYAQAEAADAAAQCPAAYGDYNAAIQTAMQWNTVRSTLDTASERAWVETVRQLIKGARKTWYAVGCGSPGGTEAAATVQTAQEVVVPETGGAVQAGLAGGGIGTFLLVGAGVFGLLYALDRARKGKKTSTRRKTTRRTAPRRRRVTYRRRRR